MNKSVKQFLRTFLILLLCASMTFSVFAIEGEGGGEDAGQEQASQVAEAGTGGTDGGGTSGSTTGSTSGSTSGNTSGNTTGDNTDSGTGGNTDSGSGESTGGTTGGESSDDQGTVEPEPEPSTSPKPAVTKHPTDEIITVDGRAVFIARADNAADLEWLLLSPDGKTSYTIEEAKKKFPRLKVTGDDTDKLVFEMVPLSMDGYKVYAVFTNATGTVDTNTARLTVRKAELVPPYIKSQPKSATAQLNEPVTLSVTVDDPNEGTTLKYQWYSSSTPSTAGGSMVGGGNSATYTPSTQYKGTTYYFVKVWAESSDQTSSKTTSQVVSVAVADPTPTTEETTAPTTEAATAPEETVPETTLPPAQPAKKGSNAVLFVVLFMLLLIAFGATITAIYLIRRDAMGGDDNDYDDEPELSFPKLNLPKMPKIEFVEKKEEHKFAAREDRPTAVVPPIPPVAPQYKPGWICQCGSRNRGSYCQDCGNLKPDYAIQYACDNCGWEAPDPQNPPKQCPQCGQMYNVQDIEF